MVQILLFGRDKSKLSSSKGANRAEPLTRVKHGEVDCNDWKNGMLSREPLSNYISQTTSWCGGHVGYVCNPYWRSSQKCYATTTKRSWQLQMLQFHMTGYIESTRCSRIMELVFIPSIQLLTIVNFHILCLHTLQNGHVCLIKCGALRFLQNIKFIPLILTAI